MKIVKEEVYKTNGKIVSLFLFQYALLAPFMLFLPPMLVVAASGVLLMGICFLYNISAMKMNIKIIIFYMIILCILIMKNVIDETSLYAIIYFVAYAVPCAVVFLYKFDVTIFLETCYILSFINFFCNFWTPLVGNYSYMRFGYAMLLTAVCLYVAIMHLQIIKTKKQLIISWFFLIVTVIEMLAFGARGAFFSLILSFAIDVFFISKRNILRNVIIITIGIILYNKLILVLDILEKFTQSIGIYSYSITKYKMQIENNWGVASSGRDQLYEDAMEAIRTHPFVGNPIRPELNLDYSHNLFLQAGMDLGIFAIIAIIILLAIILLKFVNNAVSSNVKLALLIMTAVSIGRLVFSSNFWERPEFWMLICFVVVSSSSKFRVRIL